MSSLEVSIEEQMKLKSALRKLNELFPLNAANIERGCKVIDKTGEGLSNVSILAFMNEDEKTLTPEKFAILRKWALDSIKSILGDMELKRIVLDAQPDFRAQMLEIDPFTPKPMFLDAGCPSCGKLTPGTKQLAAYCIHCGSALK